MRARLGRDVVEDARPDPCARLEPARAAAHQHAPVGRRPEVVEEHAAVCDRLAACPSDLLQQFGDGLGQDDGAGERRLAARERPAGPPCVQREHDLAGTDTPVRRPERTRADGRDRRVLEDVGARVAHGALQCEREPRGLDDRTVAEEDAAAEARGVDPLAQLDRPERDRFLLDPQLARRPQRVLDDRVLMLGRRDLEQPALTQPDVLASLLDEVAHRGHDRARGMRELERGAVAEHRPESRERRPVAVEEAAVAAARPVPDLARLEHRDAQRGIALAEGESGPEPRVPAPDDGDVHVERAGEGRCDRLGSVRPRLLEPPRRPRRQGWCQAPRSHRRDSIPGGSEPTAPVRRASGRRGPDGRSVSGGLAAKPSGTVSRPDPRRPACLGGGRPLTLGRFSLLL